MSYKTQSRFSLFCLDPGFFVLILSAVGILSGIVRMNFDRHEYSVLIQTPVHPNVDITNFENADTDADTDIEKIESQTVETRGYQIWFIKKPKSCNLKKLLWGVVGKSLEKRESFLESFKFESLKFWKVLAEVGQFRCSWKV